MNPKINEHLRIYDYIKFMFISPITTWWGAITFLIEILAFLLVGQSLTLNRIGIFILLFIFSFTSFVSFLIVFKGWSIFSNSTEKIHLVEIVRDDKEQFFILRSQRNYKIGTLLEISRRRESAEYSIGFIEITHERDDGLIQAKPIWILPIHQRDIEKHEVSFENLIVQSTLSNSILPRWINDQANNEIQELLKKGVN